METTAFPAAQVEALFQTARAAAEANDPLALLAVYPCLRLKPGYTLHTQFYSDGANGNGFTYAYPAGTKLPPPKLKTWPKAAPKGALDPSTAIAGDGTPWSYLCASIFARELAELGARWHGCHWSTHSLFAGQPAPVADPEWQLHEPWPGDFSPTVTFDQQVTVIFYTMSELGHRRVERHVDVYRPSEGLIFTAQTQTVASAPGGFIF